jgi:hypothetical protein
LRSFGPADFSIMLIVGYIPDRVPLTIYCDVRLDRLHVVVG